MKYRVIRSTVDESFDVITEDGGASYHYHNGEHWVSNYYEGRLINRKSSDLDWWIELQDEGMYVHDWDVDMDNMHTIVVAALEWLAFPHPDKWELDNSIFNNILNQEI
jgi:hypothetical protein